MSMAIPSSEELNRRFDTEGYVILKGVLKSEEVDGARQELKHLVDQHAQKLLAEGKIDDLKEDLPFEKRLIALSADNPKNAMGTLRRELHLPGLYPIFFNPQLTDVVESVLGSEIRLYPNYSARPKLPESEATLVLWHQDGGYTDQLDATGTVDELRMVNVWTPLVPARVETGCMEFIPGTHKLGVVPHEKRRYYLEIAQEHLAPYEDKAIPIEMDPGDVVLFHNLLYHRGLPNTSDIIRWNLDWRYQDATQPTLREQDGHLVRSKENPSEVVKSAEDWASRSFN